MTRRRRRPFAGFSDSDSVSEDVVETPQVNVAPGPSSRVQEIVRRAQAERDSSTPGDLDDTEDLSPESRLEQVRNRAPKYEREYRLRLVHRLLMRKLPLDEIAAQLSVSVSTVQRDRAEIYQRLANEASRLNINALLGETMAFYGETGAMAMRIATTNKTATPHRLAALRTAMTSKKELGQWLAAAGVFDQLKYVPEDEAQSGDLAALIKLSEQILLDDEDNIENLGTLEADDLLDDESISLVL